jgi:membrane-bound lytic murein transglycosylase MltF
LFRKLSRLVADQNEVLRMCDAAYNGGYGGLQQERRACGQRAGCDPQKWFAHVEQVCLKSKVKWKGYGAIRLVRLIATMLTMFTAG